MKKIILFSTLMCIVLSSWSQQRTRVTISGIINDAKTGAPLPGASILLVESKQGAVADSNGRYIFRNIPPAHTLIEISHEGYRSLVEHLDITTATEKNFSLTQSIIENEAVTVTAVGSATSIRKAPIPITRVNREELLLTSSTNIIDALRKQPGVSQISSGPAISKPVIRGLGYNRLIVINDGVRQEGQQWGDEHGIEIDENSVSRIELVKGPASLIYGSDALAGVINIITTQPVPANTIRGNILSSYGTNNRQRSLFGSIAGNQKGFSWSAWGDYKAAADYKNKYDGYVWNSKFNEKNAGGSIGYNNSWGYTRFIFSRFNQQIGLVEGERDVAGNFIKALPGGLEGTPAKIDFKSIDPSVPYQHIIHTKAILDNSFGVGSGRLTVNLALQRNQRQEFGNVDDPSEKSLFFDLHTFNYNTAYHLHERGGWATTVGVNGMAQNNKNKGIEVLIPEYSMFDIGSFVYTQKTIGKSTISGGVRYDNRHLTSEALIEGGNNKFNAFSKNFSNVSGSAGVSYAVTNSFTIKANLARGFRAPSIPELASNGAHEGTNRYEYGTQNLKSETSVQGDLGIELNSDHVLFSTSVFYNHINDFIFYSKLKNKTGNDSMVLVDMDYIPAYQFGQRTANLYGFEASLDLHPHPLDWLHWENNLSYVRGRFPQAIEGVHDVPFIPASRWISELRAEFFQKANRPGKLALFLEFDHTFKQNKPFTAYETETATPGYSLLNAGARINAMRKGQTLFSLYLLANNLTDVAYQNHLSRLKYADVNSFSGRQGVYNMGRTFMFRLNIPLNFKTGKAE